MSFDIKALSAFSGANLGSETAIANLGKGGTVQQNGTYKGAFIGMFRGKKTMAANNAVRTELLRSLGTAFGLEGIGRNEKGVATFSKSFMDKLAKLLGPAFKRDDFGIGDDGTVKSGKPLTQRRISAIMTSAISASRGEYDGKVYRTKLDLVNAELAKLDPNAKNVDSTKSYFNYVGKCMDFLENDFERLIQENSDWSEERARTDKDYDVPRFMFVKPGAYEGEPCPTRTELVNYIAYNSTIKPVLHWEQYSNLPKALNTPEDVKANMDYVRNTLRMFIQTSIDLFLDAKAAGKLPELMEKMTSPGACMDDKASRPGLWRKDLGLLGADEDIGPVALHDKTHTLNQCIGLVIGAITKENPNVATWAQIADQVKAQLVGVVRPIDVPNIVVTRDKNGGELVQHNFKPLVGETGKPVVRAITAADIDAIGETVLDNILYG